MPQELTFLILQMSNVTSMINGVRDVGGVAEQRGGYLVILNGTKPVFARCQQFLKDGWVTLR